MRTIMSYRNPSRSFLNDEVVGALSDFTFPGFWTSPRKTREFPSFDVEDTENHYLLVFDLPGVKKEDLNLEAKDGVLTLSGVRKNELKKEGYSERFQGHFEKTFALPEHLNLEGIEAHYENGVLTVLLPKAEAKLGKKIEIGQGDAGNGLLAKVLKGLKKEETAA